MLYIYGSNQILLIIFMQFYVMSSKTASLAIKTIQKKSITCIKLGVHKDLYQVTDYNYKYLWFMDFTTLDTRINFQASTCKCPQNTVSYDFMTLHKLHKISCWLDVASSAKCLRKRCKRRALYYVWQIAR